MSYLSHFTFARFVIILSICNVWFALYGSCSSVKYLRFYYMFIGHVR